MSRETTKQFLDDLKKAPLFDAVGRPVCEGGHLVVASWQEAVEYGNAEANRDMRMDSKNEITMQLPQERLNGWNETLAPIKADVMRTVSERLGKCVLKAEERRRVSQISTWDLMAVGMEYEYADVIATSFYRDLAQWYLRGHFVCGWDYTEGYFRLILY